MTDDEILAELDSDSLRNRVRKIFSSEAARIEQAEMQRTPLSPIECRRMEFAATERLIAEVRRETIEECASIAEKHVRKFNGLQISRAIRALNGE